MNCDNEKGLCNISPITSKDRTSISSLTRNSFVVHYIGDPMCSWCWGISDVIIAVERYCRKQGFKFVITPGGLRAGGGDEWNENFKNFLRNEWSHINKVTGKPFNYSLLTLDRFSYDTEPACRAVVTASIINTDSKLNFFHEIQKKFYTESADPTELDFYKSICNKLNIDFTVFKEVFNSNLSTYETFAEFNLVRKLGVNSFPTILVEKKGKIHKIFSGYISEQDLINKISKIELQLN